MSTAKISDLGAVTAPNLDDTSLFEVEDKNSASKKATMAQTRTQINTGQQTITGLIDISGASAGQVKFPATQNPSSDVNTLDDYEEGDFTATILMGTSGTITLTSGSAGDLCSYTKVGRMVKVGGYLTVASVSSPVGAIYITGLPFTPANVPKNWSAAAVSTDGMTSGVTTSVQAYLVASQPGIQIPKYAAGAQTNIGAGAQAGTVINFSLTYHV